MIWFNLCYGGLTRQHRQLLPQGVENYVLTTPQAMVDGVKHDWPLVAPTASVQFDLNGENITLDLQRNDGLIHSAFHHSYDINGRIQRRRRRNSQPFCHYHGRLRQSGTRKGISDVAITACRGINGVFQHRGVEYSILPLDDRLHAIYRTKDSPLHQSVHNNKKPCTFISLPLDVQAKKVQQNLKELPIRYRRDNAIDRLKYIELAIVNDKRSFDMFRGNLNDIENHAIRVANYIDLKFRPINVYVTLTSLVTWSETDKIKITESVKDVISNFRKYSVDTLRRISNGFDTAQLLSGMGFSSILGVAYVSSICTDNSVGVVQNSLDPLYVAAIMAHEIGHNLGMNHDDSTSTKKCSCNDYKPDNINKCTNIMNSYMTTPSTQWFSDCSVAELNGILNQGRGRCLFNFPRVRLNPLCGNGLKEEGEICDCGSEEECNDPCCNATTCQLKSFADCISGECCHNCQFKPRSMICREKVNECDVPEYCSGRSAQCPINIVKQSLTSCANDTGYCYNGTCLNRDEQCRSRLGSSFKEAPATCWDRINIRGDKNGFCKKVGTDQFIPCSSSDVKCGKLQCECRSNAKMMRSIPGNSFHEVTKITKNLCKNAAFFSGLFNPNNEMVLDGTKCGDKKICFQNQCRDMHSVIDVKPCHPSNCSNHGVCNSNGNCHCDDGYAPPACDRPGNGGSIDNQ